MVEKRTIETRAEDKHGGKESRGERSGREMDDTSGKIMERE